MNQQKSTKVPSLWTGGVKASPSVLSDGLFEPEGYEPHIVRGVAFKEPELAKDETTVDDKGRSTNTKTYRENIKLKVRCLTPNGTITEIK